MDESLRDQVQEALKGHDARYIEVRIDEVEGSQIRFRGKELEEIGRTTGIGGCIRALADGWGFYAFNELEGLREKVALAVRNAHLVSNGQINLAPVAPVVDSVPPATGKDPRTLSLQQKKAVLDEYVDTIWSVPGVTTSNIGYADGYRKRVVATSEGTYVQQERVDVSLRINAMARDGGDVQQSGVSLGSTGDFGFVEGLHNTAGDLAKRAVDLLRAPSAAGGEYTVVLDPVLAGVFIHEAFGHLSEADHVYGNPRLREIMIMNRRFGGPHLNVVDGAAVPGLRGSYKYDDEATPAAKTYLLKEGRLVGRLHSRETAAAMGESATGNARAISHQFPPIVRMTNTYIEPGTSSFDDMVSDIKDGLYVRNWYGGMTSMEQFTFSAGEAYAIRNGKIEELMRPVLLSGNVFTTLDNLDAVGDDLDMNQGGGCGKNGQSPLPVSNGSPHIRIQKCLISGNK